MTRFLSLLGAATVVVAAPWAATAQVLTVRGGGTPLTIRPGALLAVRGDAQVATGTTVTNAGTLDLSGNWQGPAATLAAGRGTLRLSGTAPQTLTANGSTVANLVVDKASGTVTLDQPLSVREVLTMASAGNLALNGQALLLLSNAAGTALVANIGAGLVTGNTGTMQRYIGRNTGRSGFRQYSSPVSGETLNTLATTGFTPVFNGPNTATSYNNSATPYAVTPMPTVYFYNQDRIATTTSNIDTFDKGWQAPLAGTEPMPEAVGFSVQAPGTVLVDFTGTFRTGDVTRSNLNRLSADPKTGWHLLGNPYPSPLDWSTMTTGPGQNLENIDGAVYVYQSTGPKTGTYRTYLAGAPVNGSPIIPAGSGFFVHSSTPGTPGTVRLTNANRVTTFGPQPAFGRGAADPRPRLTLNLTNAAGSLRDEATLYVAAGPATAGVEPTADALKLGNPNGLNIATLAATGEALSIDGRAAISTTTLIPLQLETPAAGTYTLDVAAANLPAGLTVYLRHLTTDRQVALMSATTVQLPAGLSTGYALAFAPAGALATGAGLTAAQVALFPNPVAVAAQGVTVTLPAAAAATATVLDALGRVVVPTRALAVAGGQATGLLPTAGLAAGVYAVRLTSDGLTLSKRLVVE